MEKDVKGYENAWVNSVVNTLDRNIELMTLERDNLKKLMEVSMLDNFIQAEQDYADRIMRHAVGIVADAFNVTTVQGVVDLEVVKAKVIAALEAERVRMQQIPVEEILAE